MKGIAFADGGSRGNPGPAGIGALIKNEAGETVCEVSEFIGRNTNNVAEWTALLRIMEKALELGFTELEVNMDSELVVKQMHGEYRVKHEGLIPLFTRSRSLSVRFKHFSINHVRRAGNSEADKLANAAMDRGDQVQTKN